jgi:hypothetical protein
MREVTLEDIRAMAAEAASDLQVSAASVGRDVKIYMHWTAGRYAQTFGDYHLCIDGDGRVYAMSDSLADVLPHTYRRNTGAIGVALCCAYGATPQGMGDYPPTDQQIEAVAQVVAALSGALGLPIDIQHAMTHAEAADNMDGVYASEPYGPAATCERWDLAILCDGDAWMSGGGTLRGKAVWYANQ